MSEGTKHYTRAFMAMIGMVFLLAGIVGNLFLKNGFVAGVIFKILGFILVVISIYWWYRDYQKRP